MGLTETEKIIPKICTCYNEFIPIIEYRTLKINPNSRIVTMKRIEITLARREFDILYALIKNKGIILSRIALADMCYKDEEINSNAIEVYICLLRKKIGKNIIKCVRHHGYYIPTGACNA